ncbi:MAG: anti-sigma factor [Chloroflexi bacterium]|nr:anti-sigma factor [Chloroflexota bacterium]
MHLNDGDLTAYYDDQLASSEKENVRRHLLACEGCQRKAERIQALRRQADLHLAILNPKNSEQASFEKARLRLSQRFDQLEKENQSMWNKINSRSLRPVWAVATTILVVALLLAFPSVRALATNFLGLFRVQQITIVPVNLANLPQNMNSASPAIQNMLSQDTSYQVLGKTETVANASQASKLAGFNVRLPSQLQGSPKLTVQAGAEGSFTVNLPQVKAILQELGRSDIQLPDNLNNAVIKVNIPQSVTATYGTCDTGQLESGLPAGPDPAASKPDLSALAASDCTVLIQMDSPTVSAPPDLDITQLGVAFLEAAGMSPEQAQSFAQQINWSTTLVIPVPSNIASYEEVQVDGVTGTLIQQSNETANPRYLLMWVKGNIVYALSGSGDPSQAVSLANSMK